MEQSALLTDEQKNRIVWEPEPAENAGQSRNTLSDEQFGRIVWDSEPAIEPGQYTPTQRQWGSFFSAFSEDPLLVIPDGIAREALRRGVAALPDPELEKKKIALAAYYTQGNPDNFRFTLGNLDGFIERYHGRKLSPDAAFGEVAAILAGEQAEASKSAWEKNIEAEFGMMQNVWYGFGSFLLKAGHGIREPLMPLVEGHFNLDKIGRISREREREKFAATTRDAWLRGQQTALNRFYESLEPWSRRQLKVHYDQRIAELERQRHAMAGETKGRLERLDADDATTWSEDYRNRWKTVFDGLEEKAAEAQRKYHTDKTIAAHFADGEFGGALLESLAVAVDQVGQSVIPQAAAFLAGGPAASVTALAASSMGERSNQLTGLGKNSPEVLASATIYAAAEAIPEYFLGLVPIFKMFKGTGKKATAEAVTGVRRKIGRFLKDFAGSGASDTTGELITFTAEKLQDFIEGVNTPDNKRLWEMSRSEIVEFSLEGLPETIVGSFLTAGPLGAAGAIQERRALIEMDRQRQEALRMVKNRRDELLNKENPTGEEVREIQQLNTVLDAGNINKSAKLVEEVQAVTELKAADETQQPVDPDSEMDVQELADEAEAKYWTRQQTLAHNPADTADRVRELAALYPGVNTEVVDDPAMFSDAARTEAARREIDLDNVRGFYDPATNTMVVNAARVRPSEVPALALHEIVGHAGLKQVLGNAYEQMLDGVIRAHRDDLGTIPLRYNLDLDTVKGQREAAEEYIAHIAEGNPDLKPSWWREFLQQIKMLLRRVPGLENLRYTDREIEAMLARSARAMRRSGRSGEAGARSGKVPPPDARANALRGRADVSDVSDRADGEGGMRFAVNADVQAELDRPLTPDEKRAVNRFLDEEPIAEMKEHEVPHFEKAGALVRYINEYYAQHGARTVSSSLGFEISLEGKAVSSSVAHGIHPAKVQAFLLVPDIIRKGIFAGKLEKNNANDPNAYLIVAPVRIGTERYTGLVEFIVDPNINRMKLHDAILQKNSSASGYASVPKNNPARRGAVRKLLEDIRSLKYNINDSGEKSSTSDDSLQFSMSEYSDQDMETFATILRPFVGLAMDKTDAEYLAYLQEKNLPVHSEEWAHAFAAMAEQMNQEAQTRADKEKKFNWLYENIPFYRYAVDAAGTRDFKIVPSHRFAGEEFTGTFIADAWRKFSGKEKAEGKTGARRQKKLEEAAGVRSDALAETIARDIGGDAIQIENDLIDFFRDLDKRKLGSKYSDYRKESAFHDKEQEREARQEFEALRREEERNRIEEEAYSILAEGREITEEYRKAEPEVVKLVRDRLLGEQAKQYTNQQELEAINAAIRQEAGNAATYAQAYRDAREKTWQEYNERYRQLRDRVMESKADALKLQREAAAFAEKYLPPEARGEFNRRIIGLLEYSTLPNKKYPEGRRKAEFDRLQQDILNRSGEVNKTKLLGEIQELLDANKTRRNYKGIPTSAAPATQQQIDRIRFIASMNLPAAAAAIEANNTRIAELEEAGDAETAIADLRLDNTLLSTFAGLDERPAEAVREARRLLGSVILHGRAILKEQLAARQERLQRMRADVIADLTDGGMEVQGNRDGNQHAAYPLRLNSISGTLKLLSGRSIEDLANTVSGGFLRRIEDASWNESTEIRRVDDALMQAYRDIARTENVFQRAKFIRKVYTEVEHSGVFRNVYAQTREIAKNRYILRVGKRGLLRRNIPVEQARDLLRRIDAGEKVELYQDIPLTEAGLHFLRLQLADYDAGLKPAYEIFGDEQDDAQFNRMLESEAKNANLQLFAPDQGEAPPVRQEEKLSPGAALQILLTWEQPHYRPGMEWNGWTEESMEQIRKFIGPEVLQFGYWMRDFIRSRQKQLDRAVYERYGAHLPENPNYFPASFRESVKSKVKEERGGMGRGVGTMSVNPNFLIARKFHLKPVDTSVNAFEVFLNNQLETIHFLNWSETVRDLRSVYSNRDVQEAIDNQLGRNVKAKLFEGINALAQNGVPGGDAGVKAINKLIRLWVPANIAINPGSWIKQMLGAIAYSNNMPLTEWAKYSSRAAFWNADFREFADLAGNSDYMKNRMHGSLNKELQFMLSRSRSAEHYNPLLDSMMEYATWGTRATDYWASIHGGYAIYAYNRDKALAEGRSAAEATAIGLRQWQRATDQTQQSAYIKDQNSYQLNQGLYRFLTVYQSNPMQILGLQLDNLNRLRYGDKKAARKELAKMIFINHLVIPPLMLAVNEILRNGFDFEEWDWEDFFIAAAFGNLSSAFLWGQFLFNASNAAADKLLHRPMWRTSNYSALPMLDDATNSLTQLIGLVDKDEITEKEILGSMQSIGNLMMTTAPFPGAAGAISKAGAVMKFTTTQAKRIYNLFAEK